MKLALKLLVLVIMATFSLTACGGGEEKMNEENVTEAPKEASVSLKGYRFNPNTLTIAAGTTVTFSNEDPEVHNIQIASLNVDQNIDPGASWSYTFATTGEFAVGNRLATNPMNATIVVE